MRKLIVSLAVSLFAGALLAADATDPACIPQPQKIKRLEGAFTLTPQTRIYADWASRETAKSLASRIRQSTGYPMKVVTKYFSDAPVAKAILLTIKHANANLGPEGYELSVASNTVILRAPTQAGLFYGVQTLLQLLPPKIFSTNVVAGGDWQMPCVQIEDCPRFKWRGLMLDVSRHFFNKAEVEKVLDEMAMYKFNTFHWHLVDDGGWRIEIKKYPKLTQIGAWRDGIGWKLDPKSSTAYGPDGQYGGYYTQDDIREVVAYAAARHITVVPEIEMPGHSSAALKAYPQLGCTDSTNRFARYLYSPANPETYEFLENVLSEVLQLFPGKYIHVGGDEVPMDVWPNSPACRALMQREGLKDSEALQNWFTRHIEKFVNAHGRTLLGWMPILRGGLAANATAMDWKGGAREAASEGHDVVMTPNKYCYFNYYQSTNRAAEPRAEGSYIPLRKTYAFEPIPGNLPAQFQSHILGAQGSLWTEWIPSLSHAEYMLFPRLCALAEVVWSPKDSRNWDDFVRRLKVNEQRLDELGVTYRPATSESIDLPQPAPPSRR